MGTKIQWVNYPNADGRIGRINVRRSRMTDGDVKSVDDMGRTVYLKVKFKKKDKFSLAKLTLKRHADNAAYTRTERAKNAGVFMPTRETFSIVSWTGEALFGVKLTPAGGDKYKFEAENLVTGKKVQGKDVIETRRKLFYQMIRMRKAHQISGGLKNKLKKRFWDPSNKLYLKLEEYAGGKTTPNRVNFNDEDPPTKAMVLRHARRVYNNSKAPYSFVVLFVNKNCIPGTEVRAPAGNISGNSTNVNTRQRLFSYADPAANDFGSILWIPSSTGLPEAFTKADYKRVGKWTMKLNTRGKTRGPGRFVYTMTIVSIEGMGLSLSSENLVTIASRDCDGKKVKKRTQLNILVHEIGHKIGMVPGRQGDRDLDTQSTYYHGRGHSGGHCRHPSPLLPTYSGVNPAPPPQCTMFGDIRTNTEKFCPKCLPSVRKLDIDPARKVGIRKQF